MCCVRVRGFAARLACAPPAGEGYEAWANRKFGTSRHSQSQRASEARPSHASRPRRSPTTHSPRTARSSAAAGESCLEYKGRRLCVKDKVMVKRQACQDRQPSYDSPGRVVAVLPSKKAVDVKVTVDGSQLRECRVIPVGNVQPR